MAKKRTAQHWHLVHELLHYGTKSTQSPRDSGSRIDTPSQNVENYGIGQLSGWVQVRRAHKSLMGRRVVLGELVTKGSAAGLPINEKLAFLGAVLDPIEAHVDGFEYFLFDCAVGEAFSGVVVDADRNWWLRVPKFTECGKLWHWPTEWLGTST